MFVIRGHGNKKHSWRTFLVKYTKKHGEHIKRSWKNIGCFHPKFCKRNSVTCYVSASTWDFFNENCESCIQKWRVSFDKSKTWMIVWEQRLKPKNYVFFFYLGEMAVYVEVLYGVFIELSRTSRGSTLIEKCENSRGSILLKPCNV